MQGDKHIIFCGFGPLVPWVAAKSRLFFVFVFVTISVTIVAMACRPRGFLCYSYYSRGILSISIALVALVAVYRCLSPLCFLFVTRVIRVATAVACWAIIIAFSYLSSSYIVTTRYIGKSQVDKVYILKNSKLRRKEV
jgi:hypothetical protein